MRIDILTLFPEMFSAFDSSIVKRAKEKDLIDINLINIRDFSEDKHKNVDDTPYGGGEGMLMTCQPVFSALRSIDGYDDALKIIMCPQGVKLDQDKSIKLANNFKHIIILCGHYEGFDERIRNVFNMELSIGDYILTGGELGAMVLVDSVVRLLDGVIKKESHLNDTFSNNLLKYPEYTRPQNFEGMEVPEVLLSGNHEEIAKWRKQQSILKTRFRRPDLFNKE